MCKSCRNVQHFNTYSISLTSFSNRVLFLSISHHLISFVIDLHILIRSMNQIESRTNGSKDRRCASTLSGVSVHWVTIVVVHRSWTILTAMLFCYRKSDSIEINDCWASFALEWTAIAPIVGRHWTICAFADNVKI